MGLSGILHDKSKVVYPATRGIDFVPSQRKSIPQWAGLKFEIEKKM